MGKEIDFSEMSYSKMLKMIESGENFTWTRWGDGEIEAMLYAFAKQSRRKWNTDQHQYFPDMGRALRQVLRKGQNYYHGLQQLGQELWGEAFRKLLGPDYKRIQWCESDTLHTASIKGSLNYFFDALKKRNVLMVCSEKVGKINMFDKRWIVIPERNCWRVKPYIVDEVISEARANDVILWSASMMSEVAMDEVWDVGGIR